MRRLLILPLLLAALPLAAQPASDVLDRLAFPAVDAAFVENAGQWPGDVAFLARLAGVDVWVTSDGITYDVSEVAEDGGRNGRVLRVGFGDGGGVRPEGRGRRAGGHSYFLGDDPGTWAAGVGAFEEVVFYDADGQEALRLYEADGLLQHAISDEARTTLTLEGADGLGLSGPLDVAAVLGQAAPSAEGGEEQAGALPALRAEEAGWARFLGGFGQDFARAVAVADDGSVFVGGQTTSSTFSGLSGSYDGSGDGFVAQLSPDGALRYGTYLGGNRADAVLGAAYHDGTVYVVGVTASPNFPTTAGAYKESKGGPNEVDAFVTRLRSDGLGQVFSTFLGGSGDDVARAVAVTPGGEVVVGGTTYAEDFPASGSYRGGGDAFVVRLSPDGSALRGGRLLGGRGLDELRALALGNGALYAAGETDSGDFGDIAGGLAGGTDAFVVRLSSDASAVTGGRYVGGSGLEGDTGAIGLAVGPDGVIYLAGGTTSADFPASTSVGPGGGEDAFVARLAANAATLLGASVIGGSGVDRARAVAVGADGSAHLAGETWSSNFPVTARPDGDDDDDDEGGYGGEGDAFVVRLGSAGALLFGTYLGGDEEDGAYGMAVRNGLTYVVGDTQSEDDFPVSSVSPPHRGATDAFVATFDLDPNDPPVVAQPLDDVALTAGIGTFSADLASVFDDPDGDALSFACQSSAPSVATVAGCAGGTLVVTPLNPGTATVTVSATDGGGLSVQDDFVVTVAVNQAPVVVAPISDVTLTEGQAPIVVDLAGVFEDPEGAPLTFSCSSSSPSVASLSGCAQGRLEVNPVGPGSATVTVSASDGFNAPVADAFSVTVVRGNAPPVVASPIADAPLVLGGSPLTVALTDVFDDPDGDALSFVCASSAPSVAAVSGCASGTLVVTAVAAGTATVTVTASDPSGEKAVDAFAVTVTNPRPVITNQLADIELELGGEPFVARLDTVFSDPNGDTLSFTCQSSSPAVASVAECGDGILRVAPGGEGVATITVTASDGPGSVADAFVVTVVNPPPVVVRPIADVALLRGGEPVVIDLASVFEDPNGDALSYTLSADAPVVTLALDGSMLSVAPNRLGSGNVTVRASDGSGSVTETFAVTVTDDPPPVVVAPPADTTLVLGAPPLSRPLGEVFEDPEGDALTFACQTNAPTVAAVGDCAGGTLEVVPVGTGTALITLSASDGSSSVGVSFTVTVVPDNAAPFVARPLADQTLRLSATPFEIDLDGVFEDPDGDPLTLTCASATPAVVSVDGCGDSVLTLTLHSAGAAAVTVTASDPGGDEASDTFVVTVTGNAVPVVSTPLPDVTLGVESEPLVIPLGPVFLDPDGDALAYVCTSSDPAVASANACDDGILTVEPNAEGTATIEVRASDPQGAEASDTFVVTVIRGNAPPFVTEPLADLILGIGGGPFQVNLDGVFDDPDGDALTFACASGTPAVVEAGGCASGTLTLTPRSAGTAAVTVTASDPGGDEASDTFVVTVGCEPAVLTDVTASPTVPDAGQDVTIRALVTGAASATLWYRRGGEATYDGSTMAVTSGGFVGTLPDSVVSERGVDYYVEAASACGASAEAGPFTLQVRVPGGVMSRALPPASGQGGYRLVSVPLALESDRADVVLDALGEAGDAWRAFHLLPPGVQGDVPADGADEQWYLGDPAAFDLVPGRAFWLITREGGRFNSGAGTTVASGDAYALDLHRGWNLVGAPFGHDVPLSGVRLESGAPVQLHAYDGAWEPETERMQPFHGYALRLLSDDRLVFEPDTEPARTSSHARPEESGGWAIAASAAIGPARDDHNRAVADPAAQEGHDVLDWFEPPVIGDYVSLAFEGDDGEALTVDARPVSEDGAAWRVAVRSNLGGRISLTFDGIERVPPGYAVWLADEATGAVYDLRERHAIDVRSPAGSAPVRLRLLVGTEDFVRSSSGHDGAVPTEYGLGHGFPNPFRSAATFPFSLPQPGPATLDVLDALGRSVATLVDGHVEAGHHRAVWDAAGAGVASGPYLVRLRAGDVVVVRRVIFLR